MTKEIPDRQDSALAWYGPDLAADPGQWIIELTDAEVTEIRGACEAVREQKIDIVDITAGNFPLPSLESRVEALSQQLINGIGFALLRRIPVEDLTIEQSAIMFYGLGAHLGNARMQNGKGHVLGHVCDLDVRSDSPDVRIYQTNERQTFHTDSCDVVGLLCLKKAKHGGESLLVSAVTIFNEMLENRPDLVAPLFDPIATDRRGEVPAGMAPYFSIPVFTWAHDFLTVMYQRQYIDSAQRFDGALKLTPAHIEALDLFDELANDPRLNLSMQLEPGDLQFVYNHGLLHDRTGFEDWPDRARRRHLLRLWLSVPGDRILSDVFSERFGSIEPGFRGGVAMEDVVRVAPLEPV